MLQTKMEKLYSKNYYLNAGECNTEGELPMWALVGHIIEVATLHANSWGVGYAHLIKHNQAWVLSRVTVEMQRYPRVDEHYTITTWIEDYNSYFSQRNFEIQDAEGHSLGFVRTIWMVIDLAKRTGADIADLSYLHENVSNRPCPIEPQERLRPLSGGETTTHRVSYTDCDFNRHMNTVRYVELLMNQFDLSFFDKFHLQRVELAFLKETRYGEEVTLVRAEEEPRTWRVNLMAEGTDHVRSRFMFRPRE